MINFENREFHKNKTVFPPKITKTKPFFKTSEKARKL